MRLHHLLLAVFATLACTLLASALEFQPIGFEAIGMGGAGVACAKGSMAGYYNPALLAHSRYTTEVNLSLGAGLKEYNLLDSANKLSKLDMSSFNNMSNTNFDFSTGKFGTFTAADRSNIVSIQGIWNSLGSNNGIDISPAVALGVQVLNVGVGIYTTGDATAVAHINPNQNQLIFKQDNVADIAGTGKTGTVYFQYNPVTDKYTYNAFDASGASMGDLGAQFSGLPGAQQSFLTNVSYNKNLTPTTYNNTSIEVAINDNNNGGNNNYIAVRGLVLNEIPISYAHAIPIPEKFGTLAVGGSLKLISGITYDQKVSVNTQDSTIQDDLTKNSKTTMTGTIDLGAIYNPPVVKNLSIGVVMKDLTSPKFDYADGGSAPVDPQARMGVDYSLWHDRVDFAADLDLTKNAGLDAHNYQYACVGANFHPASWFSLRAGAMNNLADSTLGPIGTIGLGFGLKWFQLDLAAESSFKTTTVQDSTIPSYAKINLALVSKW